MTELTQVPARRAGFRPKEYAHIVLATAQPDALVEWYCKVLGMQVVMRHQFITFLTWDDSQDRLAIVPIRGEVAERPKNAPGLHHAAFEVETARVLVDQYRALKADGIIPVSCMNHGVATSIYYADPDGNQIELSVPNFANVEDLNSWLATGAFDQNPVGVMFDPEELAGRIDANEPESSILQPAPRHGERLAELLAQRQR